MSVCTGAELLNCGACVCLTLVECILGLFFGIFWDIWEMSISVSFCNNRLYCDTDLFFSNFVQTPKLFFFFFRRNEIFPSIKNKLPVF